MKCNQPLSLTILLAMLLSAALPASAAHAGGHHGHGHHGHGHHGHVHSSIGLYFAIPLAAPYYSPYRYDYPQWNSYYAAAPVYIEREITPAATLLPPNYWYYCNHPPGYYPAVNDCPVGWQQVAPRP